MSVGYAFLHAHFHLTALPPTRPAQIRPVTRVEDAGTHLAVPGRLAPTQDDPLAHLLFALKHEGVEMGILIEALRQIPGNRLLTHVHAMPSSSYARTAGYLWELANQQTLGELPPIAGAATPLFDPAAYLTGPASRNSRWRVDFNGLGTPHYCATVRRTPGITALLGSDILGRARAFTDAMAAPLRDRALAWAYLHETRESFAIERETPGEDRARAFVALLHQAHDRQPLSEAYLASLQRATLTNPLDHAVTFRTAQNWLQGASRGAGGVTYLPPPPEIAAELMTELMRFANERLDGVDPLVAAAVISFGFVLIHPFMDGNGRLSRFLYHHTLCRAGALPNGLILPVSIAMKRHEPDYLRALQSFSQPARERWSVTWHGEGNYAFAYHGAPDYSLYRYWDATACVEFGLRMAESALDVELRQEVNYLARFDRITSRVLADHDVRGSDLATLVIGCLDHNGALSKRRRDQFAHTVPAEVFERIEQETRAALADLTDSDAPVPRL